MAAEAPLPNPGVAETGPPRAPATGRQPVAATESTRVWTGAFTRYWSATTVSNLGSGVSLVAIPILAAGQLHAGAAELGYLRALEAAPYLLLALVVGHLAD